ncbi:MAG: polyprenyl synthetase family protein [Candidatus Altiarchaeota archaeon]|nr:polyprenyl synthetase family protein [Candidatus Altiarchaeota archaeon]
MDGISSYGDLVEEELAHYIRKDLEPKELYGPIYDLFSRGGKRIRPVLCLLACESVGGRAEDALKTAAAIEMIHNFTLIHDDIVDKSELRRGRPCLHHTYGLGLAINSGDGLFSMAYGVMNDNLGILDRKRFDGVFGIFSRAVTEVCEGQAMDISWAKRRRWDITVDDYSQMLKRKTSALIACSCECGGIIGNGSQKEIEALRSFGANIGMAFQIHDDVLNLAGEEEEYGKEIGGDINEGKRTLIIIDTISKCNEKERKRLIEILDAEQDSKKEIREALDIINKYGSVEMASKKAESIIKDAKGGLGALPDSKQKKMLLELADYFIERKG